MSGNPNTPVRRVLHKRGSRLPDSSPRHEGSAPFLPTAYDGKVLFLLVSVCPHRAGVPQGTYPPPLARSRRGEGGYPKVPTPSQGTYPPRQVLTGGEVFQGTPAKVPTPLPGPARGYPKVPTPHQVRRAEGGTPRYLPPRQVPIGGTTKYLAPPPPVINTLHFILIVIMRR